MGGKCGQQEDGRQGKHYRVGLRAEWFAGLFFICKGYQILARRYKTPVGEIDLIVRRGRLIAFVEVKYRQNRQSALEAITPKQQKRIVEAAQIWLQHQQQKPSPGLDYDTLRFDAVLMGPFQLPSHMRNVFGEAGF